ncbi:maleylacetate reductase [Gordonia polyisoprenivorans NBRC 16320 = JCM 10675]|uniref:maleylacetate reductase n=1 Tax=Gordonia polyisoprenivorans TaxID=84595 RepID=UPI00023A9EFB|nr:maleylacetate reductase [Gordonia polyisoprenivorans]GAB26235.1 maleylacetate reductase [Gordonia polyisoprenivorans NBRC 16320 = JCM 10675]
MTLRFTHDWLAQRVRFAPDTAVEAIAEESAAAGITAPMLIASQRDRRLVDAIGAAVPIIHHHDTVAMHVPEAVAVAARDAAADHRADGLISVGGGSATGLAKAVALTSGLPIIAIPTTYAGSEATPVWGMTVAGRKRTGTDPVVLPRTVIYDTTLVAGLPVAVATSSGLNAVAHCVDALWAPRTDPINRAMACDALRTLDEGLRMMTTDPTTVAHEHMLYGAYLAAVAFASAGSGLHHKICHVLGGMFDLPHADTHAVVLPHVVAFNAPHAPDAEKALAAALGAGTALAGLVSLREAVGGPTALRDIGMPESGLTEAVAPIIEAAPPGNPSPVTPEAIGALLRDAWIGKDLS